MADFELAFKRVCEKFHIKALNPCQRKAIVHIVEKRTDVFVNLPTGFGKSMIYQALPLIVDTISKASGHIVVVVSPLINLMQEQVLYLRDVGISSVCLSNIKDEETRDIEEGNFSVVYATPEALIKNERWRKMLSSSVYTSKMCAIAVDEAHVIKQWGTSNNTNKAVFRECYSRLHELRALAPLVNILALTATATRDTINTMLEVLMLKLPFVIYESPDKPNIAYSVLYIGKDKSVEHCFKWLSDELIELGTNTTRTIIYCQTIKQCTVIYTTIKAMLGKNLFIGETKDYKNVLLEMLHSCTPDDNKETICTSFQDEASGIRVLVATIAFGMGVNCKGVYRIINFGPSKNIESYIQESGRAGRDGKQSVAYIIYHGLLLNHVGKDIKQYVNTLNCRRKMLLSHFDMSSSQVKCPEQLHLCCDNCASKCECGAPDCGKLTKYPAHIMLDSKTANSRCSTRQVLPNQRNVLRTKLILYYKLLVHDMISKSANMKTLMDIKFLLGFSEQQISQVLDNCDKLFSIEDILTYVEIWDIKHAREILHMIGQTFEDCEISVSYPSQSEGFDEHDDDICLGDWSVLLDDDELFDQAIENLSLSLLSVSMNMSADETIDGVYLPEAATNALENLML